MAQRLQTSNKNHSIVLSPHWIPGKKRHHRGGVSAPYQFEAEYWLRTRFEIVKSLRMKSTEVTVGKLTHSIVQIRGEVLANVGDRESNTDNEESYKDNRRRHQAVCAKAYPL
ncbi:hypothetical protein BV22DRAFT_1123925 [Leucogyrophana mollusca]|uniref:Uncharacterized protein n=1 Tax=Leucogyrophana mollusca TaxID=85980 RepID=A0ACB8AX49_9AGAM|nr:hypothetical protein BV22DRAFT_1123925 [Leucogyrophana mollusca]